MNARPLCQTHPAVNYKTAWGCPECVRELRESLHQWRACAERLAIVAAEELDGHMAYDIEDALAEYERLKAMP